METTMSTGVIGRPLHRPVTRAHQVRPTRLTRRGRLAVSLTVLLAGVTVVLAAAVALGPSVIATDGVGDPVPVRTVTVQPGQSLWDIAAASGTSPDVRDAMYDIRQLNHLQTAELQVGQTLYVPIAD
jgi:predicted Zn-dependent protease